jgi:hypothetical protein
MPTPGLCMRTRAAGIGGPSGTKHRRRDSAPLPAAGLACNEMQRKNGVGLPTIERRSAVGGMVQSKRRSQPTMPTNEPLAPIWSFGIGVDAAPARVFVVRVTP